MTFTAQSVIILLQHCRPRRGSTEMMRRPHAHHSSQKVRDTLVTNKRGQYVVGMPKLSEREEDAPVVPKVIDFKAQIRQKESEQRARDEQFERLQALAYQPSLHAQGAGEADVDSDGGWDE